MITTSLIIIKGLQKFVTLFHGPKAQEKRENRNTKFMP